MPHNIKELKPDNSRYKQGYIRVESCKKLFESCRTQPIIYRSSYELKFINWCEKSNSVAKWGSECIGIPYINAYDGNQHTYYPDFFVEMTDGTKMVVEIKPYAQTQMPKVKNDYNMKQYITNKSKWKRVMEICAERGYKFLIVTERSIDKLKY